MFGSCATRRLVAPRGFAFVEMVSDDDAQKAINEVQQYQMDGRALVVNEARPNRAVVTSAAVAAVEAGTAAVAADAESLAGKQTFFASVVSCQLPVQSGAGSLKR